MENPAMPEGCGDTLIQDISFVSWGAGIEGFMLPKASGYLGMAFVALQVMGKGVAEAHHAAILTGARALQLTRLPVRASRFAPSLFARHGWRLAPDIRASPGLDPHQGPADNPVSRAVVLDL